MKKTMKQILTFALAAIMVLAMSGIAFAANPKTYTLEDGTSITFSDVTGEKTNVTVRFYDDFVDDITTATIIYIPVGATVDYDGDLYTRTYQMLVSDELQVYVEDKTVLGSVADESLRHYQAWTEDKWTNDKYNVAQLDTDTYVTLDKYMDDTAVVADAAATTTVTPAVITAAPTASTVLVDGENTYFEAYNIDDSNYFKLRDIAQVLSGTDAQFEVTWDSEKQAINMVTGEAYTTAGGELEAGDGTAKEYVANTSVIYLNGEEVSLTAYTIGGNNYFKLRDLGDALGFGVAWDDAAQTIAITSK